METYVYSPEKTVIAGNGTAVQTIRLGSEKFTAEYIGALATAITGVLVSLKITDKGRVLMDRAIPLEMIATTSTRFVKLPCPISFEPNSNLEISYTDISGSSNTVYLSFIGYKE